jgi:hypothetical protein
MLNKDSNCSCLEKRTTLRIRMRRLINNVPHICNFDAEWLSCETLGFHDVKTRSSTHYHLGSTNLENKIFSTTEYKLLFVRHMDRQADMDDGLVDG